MLILAEFIIFHAHSTSFIHNQCVTLFSFFLLSILPICLTCASSLAHREITNRKCLWVFLRPNFYFAILLFIYISITFVHCRRHITAVPFTLQETFRKQSASSLISRYTAPNKKTISITTNHPPVCHRSRLRRSPFSRISLESSSPTDNQHFYQEGFLIVLLQLKPSSS